MSVVHFLPQDVRITVADGTTLLEAARKAHLRVEAPCNGGGTCGKCRVRLDDESRGHLRILENRKLSPEDLAQGWALLCSTLVQGDVTVTLSGGAESGLQILEKGKELTLPLRPWIRKEYGYDPTRKQTRVWAGESLLQEEDGDTSDRIYGVAVDIGSTTVVASLLDLVQGGKLGSVSALNPQATHAQDVLSRVTLGSTPEGLALLHGEIIAEINRMIGVLAGEARIPRRRIYEVVLAGNTCMLHLAANVDPEPLGRFPYTPNISGAQHIAAAKLGLNIAAQGVVYFPPVVSGFVGADITVGVLATDLAQAAGVTLFVDIGTNGEMVLANNGALQATSTAAGPAFEGMNIACGMRAGRGAIERVDVVNGDIQVKTIGDAPAVGLCGSGLLDAVAVLVTQGVVESSGRFTKKQDRLPEALRLRFAEREGKTVFHLTPEVYLTQGDLRQVQLAKGAVRAGIDVLLARNGMTGLDVDRTLIAGSFGYHLTVRSLVDIGLFPPEFAGKVEYVGNTSRTGAEALLTHAPSRAELVEVVNAVDAVELANDEGFTKIFVAAMAFPRAVFATVGDLV
jgi:uncharacterized 2Fe-2S/4Fe-4S cluster protein (DUF4445 family)